MPYRKSSRASSLLQGIKPLPIGGCDALTLVQAFNITHLELAANQRTFFLDGAHHGVAIQSAAVTYAFPVGASLSRELFSVICHTAKARETSSLLQGIKPLPIGGCDVLTLVQAFNITHLELAANQRTLFLDGAHHGVAIHSAAVT